MLSSVWTSDLYSFFLNYLFCLPVSLGKVLSVLPSALCRQLMRIMHSNSCREPCFSATHGLLQWRAGAKGTRAVPGRTQEHTQSEIQTFSWYRLFPFLPPLPFLPLPTFFSSLNSSRGYFHSDFRWVFFFLLFRQSTGSIQSQWQHVFCCWEPGFHSYQNSDLGYLESLPASTIFNV